MSEETEIEIWEEPNQEDTESYASSSSFDGSEDEIELPIKEPLPRHYCLKRCCACLCVLIVGYSILGIVIYVVKQNTGMPLVIKPIPYINI